MNRFPDQVFIPAGTPMSQLDEMLKPAIWDHVNYAGMVPTKPINITEWFNWFIGDLTGSTISPDSTPLEIRTKICQIEAMMNKSVDSGEMVDTVPGYPLKHTFTTGVYVREIQIPKGHMVIGKIHRHEHLNFISKGKVTVVTEQGGIEELTGPITMISPPGVKRLLFTHEDTIWTTVHATTETDLDKVEAATIAKSYGEIGMIDPILKLPEHSK